VKENNTVSKAYRRLGTDWEEIAKLLPGRTADGIRNHWYRNLKAQAEAGVGSQPHEGERAPWSPKEVDALIKAQRRHGNNWTAISKLLPGRTAISTHSHWYRHLKPQLDGGLPQQNSEQQRSSATSADAGGGTLTSSRRRVGDSDANKEEEEALPPVHDDEVYYFGKYFQSRKAFELESEQLLDVVRRAKPAQGWSRQQKRARADAAEQLNATRHGRRLFSVQGRRRARRVRLLLEQAQWRR
jgi:hypothetical protein